MRVSPAIVAALILGATSQVAARTWQTARATFYGTDAWPIHEGSCGYGYLDENVATGWDVAAISDTASDYRGSCGKCKEVRCSPSTFSDGYGQRLERNSVCYNKDASVVVMVVDTCQCNYASNAFSNKRWCCGDMYHLDLSHWAYEKLADTRWGVIGLQVRDVPCDYKPRIEARDPGGRRTPMPAAYKPPAGWSASKDRRWHPSNKVQPNYRARAASWAQNHSGRKRL